MMFSERIGGLLKHARQQLNVSREELARRGGVSTRLVAELERGQRPNVSLESALKLLNAVGVSVVATAQSGGAVEIRSASGPALDRATRAMRRRRTWTGRHVLLHGNDDEPQPVHTKSKRLTAVAQVSKQAYLIASAKREHGGRRARKSSSR